MKILSILALAAALPVLAQEEAPAPSAPQPCSKCCCPQDPSAAGAQEKKGCPGARPRPHMNPEFMEKYDANKDGRLDAAEKEALKADRKAQFEKAMLEKYDADKDGQLSDEEKAAMKADFDQMRAQRGKEPRHGKADGPRGPKGPGQHPRGPRKGGCPCGAPPAPEQAPDQAPAPQDAPAPEAPAPQDAPAPEAPAEA